MLQDFFEARIEDVVEERQEPFGAVYAHHVTLSYKLPYQDRRVELTDTHLSEKEHLDTRCSFTATNITDAFVGLVSKVDSQGFSVLTNTKEVRVPRHHNQPDCGLREGSTVIVSERIKDKAWLVIPVEDVRWRDLLRLVGINADLIDGDQMVLRISCEPLLGDING
jgi:hypothetical protein